MLRGSCGYGLLLAGALPVLLDAAAAATCGFVPPECPDVSFDFAALQAQTRTRDLQIGGAAYNEHFWLRFCQTPAEPCLSSGVHEAAIVHTWTDVGEQGGPHCAALGELHTAEWELLDASSERHGMRVRYSGGDGGRSSEVHFICDRSAGTPTVLSAVEGPTHHWTLVVSAKEVSCLSTSCSN